MAWTNVVTALIGSATAFVIAVCIYPRQKRIDRETAAHDWVRKAAAEYLSAFPTVRLQQPREQLDGRPDNEVTLTRLDLQTKLNLLTIYSDEAISAAARHLYDANNKYLAVLASEHRLSSSLTPPTPEEAQRYYDRFEATVTELHNAHEAFLNSLRNDHHQHLGRSPNGAKAMWKRWLKK